MNKNAIIRLLQTEGEEFHQLTATALEVKHRFAGKQVYYRGLIEYSNICGKECFYCGLRAANHKNIRYVVTDDEVMEAVMFAWQKQFGSLVLQSGENNSQLNVHHITELVQRIHKATNHEMGITLSMGEQDEMTYREWFEAGATRYLLRIETSNEHLYRKIHPDDHKHDFAKRLQALHTLQKIGYQTGTGVMIGLPFQTIEDLADDLIFMSNLDIDMCGMGPYIEHSDTPLWQYRDLLLPNHERFNLSLKMIAILRIMMKDINIASTTAMQTLDPHGREKGIRAGANVVMPNLTPAKYRGSYLIYENKPGINSDTDETLAELERNIRNAGEEVAYGKHGTSRHYMNRK